MSSIIVAIGILSIAVAASLIDIAYELNRIANALENLSKAQQESEERK